MTTDLLTFPTFTPPAPAEPRPRANDPQALDWRSRIEAMPEDKDPCPSYRHGELAKVRAAILETLDRFGDELVRLG